MPKSLLSLLDEKFSFWYKMSFLSNSKNGDRMKKSIWQKTIEPLKIKKIPLPQRTDICIIGGGITGLSTAYFLRNANKQITLLEKGKLFQGITAKTTAKISFLQQNIYQKLQEQSGLSVSYRYYLSQKEAIALIKEMVVTHQISCDFQKVPSYLFAEQQENKEKVRKEMQLLENFGEKVEAIKDERVAACFRVKNTYLFHPLKYLTALVKIIQKKVSLLEDTLVFQVTPFEEGGYQVRTNQGTMIASQVIFACHYPFFIFPNLLPLKTYLKRESVFVAPWQEKESYTAINVDKNLSSIRFDGNQILYGCSEHLLTDLSTEEKAFEKGKEAFEQRFHQKAQDGFINQDIYSHDSLPLIGRCKEKEDLFIATAYQAWGMTNGTLAGKIISDLILKGESPYQELFSPRRKNLSLWIASLFGSIPYLKGYCAPLFSKEKVNRVKIKGKLYAVRVDEQGKRHYIEPKCPHMKCPLLWNAIDETWDCPCHGSRFDENGKLLFGPSHRNIGIANSLES